MVIVLAIISSMIGLSLAKIGQAGMSATASNTIAMQASNIASSDAALLHAVNYEDLTASNRSVVSGTAFQHETLLSNESSYTDTIKQKTVTVKVYKGSEAIPRAEVKLTRYSAESKSSGLPIGTIIAWASRKNPTDGTWLDCNGQSCAGYAELVSILGKRKVPDYRDRFLEGDFVPGIIKKAGLPNISGYTCTVKINSYDGPFGPFTYVSAPRNLSIGTSNKVSAYNTFFDASRCSSVYGKSDTVQPPAVTVRWLIKAA